MFLLLGLSVILAVPVYAYIDLMLNQYTHRYYQSVALLLHIAPEVCFDPGFHVRNKNSRIPVSEYMTHFSHFITTPNLNLQPNATDHE